MNQYKLTFSITFDEQDDPAARQHARKIAEAAGKAAADAEIKLQQVYTDKPPRGVQMG